MDAADILGAAPRSEFRPRTRPVPKENEPTKGLKGLSREVAQLTGGTVGPTSPTAVSAPVPIFTKKRKGVSKQVHWEWVGFSNSARTDGLELKHWQKKGVQWEDYPFARFNKQVEVLQYSDEEYEKLLVSDEWSRGETDNLMDFAQRFDLNFIVVQDRWPGSHTVEALKDRFYLIQRKLTEDRGLVAPEEQENVLITKPYNREHEEKRKDLLERSMTGSRDEEKEEAEILEKARKIELLLKKRRGEQNKRKLLDLGPRCAKGGVTLRSTLLKRGTEASCVGKVLAGIGASIAVCSEATEEKFKGLADDIAKLLAAHRKLLKRSAKAKPGPGQPGKPGRKRKHPLPDDEPAAGADAAPKRKKQTG